MKFARHLVLLFLIGNLTVAFAAAPELSTSLHDTSSDKSTEVPISGNSVSRAHRYIYPSIQEVVPEAYPHLSQFWPNQKLGILELVVQLFSFYGDNYEVYFLARDAELIYDFATLVSQDLELPFNRAHLLNVSSHSMNSEFLVEYLNQNGIQLALEAGREVLFVDTGFRGAIPDAIRRKYVFYNSRFHGKFFLSHSNSYTTTRTATIKLIEKIGVRENKSYGIGVAGFETIPKENFTSEDYLPDESGQLHPVGFSDTGGLQVRILSFINTEMAQNYRKDLKHFWTLPETKQLFMKRMKFYRLLASSFQSKDLDPELKEMIGQDILFSLAAFDDYLEYARTHGKANDENLTWLQNQIINLHSQIQNASRGKTENDAIEIYLNYLKAANRAKNGELGLDNQKSHGPNNMWTWVKKVSSSICRRVLSH